MASYALKSTLYRFIGDVKHMEAVFTVFDLMD